MDLIVIAFYTLCDDLLIQSGYQDDPRIQMSAAKKENLKIGVYARSYINASTTPRLRVSAFPTKPLTDFHAQAERNPPNWKHKFASKIESHSESRGFGNLSAELLRFFILPATF